MKKIVMVLFVCLFSFCGLLQSMAERVLGEWVVISEANNIIVRQCQEKAPITCCEKGATDTIASGTPLVNCAWITISTGAMRPGTSIGPGFFKVQVEEPSPGTVTPSALRYVLGYSIYRRSNEKTSAGLPKYVTALDDSGLSIAFRFDDNESVGVTYVGDQSKFNHRMVMVDAEGWATTNNPAFYDLYPGEGEMYGFIAAAN